MNWGKMNLLKNYTFCRTVSLRFEAFHKLLLTLVCNWLKFIAIVFNCLFSLTVGQKTIPRTFMFGEEVNHSKGHCFLSFQIPRPSNLVCWPLIRALVQSSKDSTKPHICLLSSSHLTNKNWSSTWRPQPVDGRRFSHPLVPFWIGEVKARCRWCTKASPEGSLVWFPFENYRLAKRNIKYDSGLRSFEQRLHPSAGGKLKADQEYISPNVGLEPTTLRLRVSWSTDWASQATVQNLSRKINTLTVWFHAEFCDS